MKSFLILIFMIALTSSCVESGGNGGQSIVNASLMIADSVSDSNHTFVTSSELKLHAGATKNATHTVIVLGDEAACEAYQINRCQGGNHQGACSATTGYYLPFTSVKTFNVGNLNEGDVVDLSVYYTSGAKHSQCFSHKISRDVTKVSFSVSNSLGSTRNPLLSPKLYLNGPEADHCKGTGVPEDLLPGFSKLRKVEVGVGSSKVSGPNIRAYGEIDKTLSSYEVPMTGSIMTDGQKFYTYVRVTDMAGNVETKITEEWTYTLKDSQKNIILLTLDDGRFGFFNIGSTSFNMGSSPYQAITIQGEAVEEDGEYFFFGKTNFESETHLFKFNPSQAISIINPMNLTLGLIPLPVFETSIHAHKGKIYFIGDKNLMEFNPEVIVSASNPKINTQASGFEVSELLLSYKNDLYFNAVQALGPITGSFRLNTTDASLTPVLYTNGVHLSGVKTFDGCTYYAKSGSPLLDTVQLKIHEPVDLINADPNLRNPRLIVSGASPMKGASFVEGQFYFNTGSLPYRSPTFSALSASVDAYHFTKCGNRILGAVNEPGAGIELATLRQDLPLSGSNPAMLSDMNSGADNGIETWIGCGVDDEIYFTGKVTGDSPVAPDSIFKYNPYAAPGVNNPRKILGTTSNFIKVAIPAP